MFYICLINILRLYCAACAASGLWPLAAGSWQLAASPLAAGCWQLGITARSWQLAACSWQLAANSFRTAFVPLAYRLRTAFVPPSYRPRTACAQPSYPLGLAGEAWLGLAWLGWAL